MFSTILFAHIIGATGVAVTIGALLFDVFRRVQVRLPNYARLLSVGLFVELATGALLAVLTPDASVAGFCQNILAYAGSIFMALTIIWWRLHGTHELQKFPTVFVRYAWLGSATVTIPALITIV